MKARLVALSLLAFVALSLTGCASGETQNASARPWSSPRTWEHGLPSGITEGR